MSIKHIIKRNFNKIYIENSKNTSQEDLPPICGFESDINDLVNQKGPKRELIKDSILENIDSVFACALHMHQPIVQAGESGELISYLKYMIENISEEDNHNAEKFAQCYKRLAKIIPELINQEYDPKIMLDYSGNLLWGIKKMGREDILSSLKQLTCDETIYPQVEWLGTFWSHAVASSTPPSDYYLQKTAWQHHFLSLFGEDALLRVQGFSLPEMHFPNHPEALYQLIKAINKCGYRWLMVQEDSVQNLDGSRLRHNQKYMPNLLQAQNKNGENVSIIALIKTQGSDTKPVGQMQPYYEALELKRQQIGLVNVPSIVSQIADGENGGVMMNEFPQAYIQAYQKIGKKNAKCSTIAMNGSEYLDLLDNLHIKKESYPVIQAFDQHKIWRKIIKPITPISLEKAISELKEEDQSFSMNGVSWCNNMSWEDGYKNVLEYIFKLSSNFHRLFDNLVIQNPSITKSHSYQEALLYLLLLETSCYRYWGQGKWTDYAKQIFERGEMVLKNFNVSKSKEDEDI